MTLALPATTYIVCRHCRPHVLEGETPVWATSGWEDRVRAMGYVTLLDPVLAYTECNACGEFGQHRTMVMGGE